MDIDINLKGDIFNWSALVQKYSPTQVAENLGYKKGMCLASKMACDNFKDDEMVKYAIDIIFSIRKFYPNHWKKDWKNDAFLSSLCTIIWEYEKSYRVLLKACEQLNDPPATLIYKLASCYNYPPEFSLLSEEKTEQLLKNH